MKTAVIGYPYVGVKLEWRELVMEFLNGDLQVTHFETAMHNLQLEQLAHQQNLGLDVLTIGDFTYYSRMTDLMLMFNLIEHQPEKLIYENYRHYIVEQANNAKQKRWFSTMYETIVPQYKKQNLQLKYNFFLDQLKNVQQELGITPRLSIIGPFTFIKLTEQIPVKRRMQYIEEIGSLYRETLQQLIEEGLTHVQFEEPILTLALTQKDLKELKLLYQLISEQLPIEIMLTTYFESALQLEELVQLPITGIGLDFVLGKKENVSALKKLDLSDKTLAIGVVNGQNIWKTDVIQNVQLVREIRNSCMPKEILLQTSTSLQFVPYSLTTELVLLPELRDSLAFADEKITELQDIKHHLVEQTHFRRKLTKESALGLLRYRQNEQIAGRIAHTQQQNIKRAPVNSRKQLQQLFLQLPKYPLTLVRLPDAIAKRQTLSKENNERVVNAILFQKELGLDVLLYERHHSFQMVEECAKYIEGIYMIKNGYIVQNGVQCIKPQIVFGDLYNKEEIFINEAKLAQQLTDKKIKMKLPGPMMMLKYAFLREVIDEEVIKQQMALILQQELLALEKIGIYIVQIEELAIFKQLPIRKEQHKAALSNAVQMMNIITSAARDTTQIHLHLCYEEMKGFAKYLLAMNGDVYVLENMPQQPMENIYVKSYPIETSNVMNAFEIDTMLKGKALVKPTQWITLEIPSKESNWEKLLSRMATLQNLKY